ncbi:hypothetical protein QBC47DRAFT_412840 [Echria macrotheca]|uniref:LIM zinc-binding domain-containing protein n=1 Tax=Echria macrotheca TaxID=438768 RepID=A0AAJ0BDI7_9PEZI|nr:hypothetical protein QBC47DRAFT_412840 [Echria macrotheca]
MQRGPPPPPPIFTCTFCWRISTQPPRVLGGHRSAPRLVCEVCYAAILDLAVCWVCGEVVVRGEECVSLGWCFWHRACYGCLFCGCRILARGVGVEELFDGEFSGGGVGGWGRNKGREVEEVPLCGRCLGEVEGEGEGEGWREKEEERMGTKVQRIVERVERDGGLTRRRWEDRDMNMRKRRMRRRVAVSGRFTDGVDDDGGDVIYVSIMDPIGRPSFRPSPTKPIPRWMRPFDGDRKKGEDDGRRGDGGSWSDTSTVRAGGRDGYEKKKNDSVRRRPTIHRAPSSVSSEPLKLPSHHLPRRLVTKPSLSPSASTTFNVPAEDPSSCSHSDGSDLDTSGGHAAGIDEMISKAQAPPRPSSTRPNLQSFRSNPVWRLARLQQANPASPLTSSEYLDRYRPRKEVGRDKAVSRLRKASWANLGGLDGGLDKRKRKPRKSVHGMDPEDGILLRKNVQDELKRLFGR